MRIISSFIILFFVFTAQSQTAAQFEELYQKGLENNTAAQRDSARVYHNLLTTIYTNPTSLQKAKLHYLKLKYKHEKKQLIVRLFF